MHRVWKWIDAIELFFKNDLEIVGLFVCNVWLRLIISMVDRFWLLWPLFVAGCTEWVKMVQMVLLLLCNVCVCAWMCGVYGVVGGQWTEQTKTRWLFDYTPSKDQIVYNLITYTHTHTSHLFNSFMRVDFLYSSHRKIAWLLAKNVCMQIHSEIFNWIVIFGYYKWDFHHNTIELIENDRHTTFTNS